MEALSKIAPLPPSRPGWMAAFLLALILSLAFLPFQGRLARLERDSSLDNYSPVFKNDPQEVRGVSLSFLLPGYMSTSAAYSFTTSIRNGANAPMSINEVFADVLLPVKKTDTSGNACLTPGSVILSKKIGEEVFPKMLMPGESLEIASAISTNEFRSILDLVGEGMFLGFSVRINGVYYSLAREGHDYVAYIANDRRQSLIRSIAINILTTQKIFWLILGASILSCRIVEERGFRDLWLNDRNGWKAVFLTMVKAADVILGMLLVGGFFVFFPRFAAIGVIVCLAALMLWLFGFPRKPS